MPDAHAKLNTAAAREHLRPLGLRQRGRSRVWLDDQRWWVGVVEFQPSSWSKGTYLNVGAMWLWEHGTGNHIRFDVGHRVAGTDYTEYESDEQFEPVAQAFAIRAAAEVQRLRTLLPDVHSAAQWLSDNGGDEQGWPKFHLGIALGLSNRFDEAAACLRGLEADDDASDWWNEAIMSAHEVAALAENAPDAFVERQRAAIDAFRSALKLDPLEHPTN